MTTPRAEVMMPLVGRDDISVVFSGMNGQPEMYDKRKHYVDSWAHPGSNVTGLYEKLYAAQAVKVMEQASRIARRQGCDDHRLYSHRQRSHQAI